MRQSAKVLKIAKREKKKESDRANSPNTQHTRTIQKNVLVHRASSVEWREKGKSQRYNPIYYELNESHNLSETANKIRPDFGDKNVFAPLFVNAAAGLCIHRKPSI